MPSRSINSISAIWRLTRVSPWRTCCFASTRSAVSLLLDMRPIMSGSDDPRLDVHQAESIVGLAVPRGFHPRRGARARGALERSDERLDQNRRTDREKAKKH